MLQPGPIAEAVVAAICELNDDVQVVDRGSYLRVLVPMRCVLTRAAIEQRIHRHFQLPGELESIMSSFKGRLSVSEDTATWEFAHPRRQE